MKDINLEANNLCIKLDYCFWSSFQAKTNQGQSNIYKKQTLSWANQGLISEARKNLETKQAIHQLITSWSSFQAKANQGQLNNYKKQTLSWANQGLISEGT